MARASNPYARRKAMAPKVAKQLAAAAEILVQYNRIRRECDDDPRAKQANDGLLRLQVECSDLAGWLEASSASWPERAPEADA